MKVLEKRESFLSELHQLMSLDKNLKTLDKEQLNKIIKILDKKGIIDRLRNFNISSIFTNDEFIDLMNSAQMQTVLNSKIITKIYNSTFYQTIVHNQTFMTFINSEACRYFIAHLTCIKTASEDAAVLIQSDTEPTGQLQSSNITWLPGEIIFLIIYGVVLAIGYLLVGVVSWPFFTGIFLLAFGFLWLDIADDLAQYTLFYGLALIYSFFIVILIEIFLILTWPLLWGLWAYWISKQEPPPFPN
jgi:hypothetical protein